MIIFNESATHVRTQMKSFSCSDQIKNKILLYWIVYSFIRTQLSIYIQNLPVVASNWATISRDIWDTHNIIMKFSIPSQYDAFCHPFHWNSSSNWNAQLTLRVNIQTGWSPERDWISSRYTDYIIVAIRIDCCRSVLLLLRSDRAANSQSSYQWRVGQLVTKAVSFTVP